MTKLNSRFKNLLQSLIATLGVSQILSACGGSNGSNSVIENSINQVNDDNNNGTYLILAGTSAAESLVGLGNSNTQVTAGLGDDLIQTFGGNDLIYGDEGNDTILSGAGNDTIYGGEGNDVIKPGDGDDEIFGGAGNDSIELSAGSDFEDGGEGTDTLVISASSLSIPFTINLQTGRYFLTPQSNSQTPNFANIENITSYSSVDLTISDTIGVNLINLSSGNDIVTSIGGDDTINTGGGNDTVFLGLGSYNVDLSGGDDTLYLGPQQSQINGGSGTDIVIVSAETGLNSVYIDLAQDFYFTAEVGPSFDGQDISLKDFENVTILGGVSSTINGGNDVNTITGGSAVDTINGGAGNDILSGGDGDDMIAGDAGIDTMTGGGGDDTFSFTSATDGADTISDFAVADDILRFVDSASLSLIGSNTKGFVIGNAADLKAGTNLIDTADNIIVLTDAVADNTGAGIQTVLADIHSGASASIGDGTVIVAAAATGDAKVWYDAAVADGDSLEVATLIGVELADLNSFTTDNFIVL